MRGVGVAAGVKFLGAFDFLLDSSAGASYFVVVVAAVVVVAVAVAGAGKVCFVAAVGSTGAEVLAVALVLVVVELVFGRLFSLMEAVGIVLLVRPSLMVTLRGASHTVC